MLTLSKATRGFLIEGITECTVRPDDSNERTYVIELSDHHITQVIYLSKAWFHVWVIWLLQNKKISRINYSFDNDLIYAIEDGIDKHWHYNF